MSKKFKKKHEKQSEEGFKKSPEPSKFEMIRPSPVSWIVFFFTIFMVILSLIPVVFPSLIVANFTSVNELEQFGISGKQLDTFETGPLSGVLFVTSGIIFGLAILHFKKRLPQSISKGFQFIFDFEVSKKVAIISMIVILAIYVAASANELSEEEQWEDYIHVKQRLETWSPDQIIRSFDEPHVNYFLISSSIILFGNYAVIPFLASIALVIMVYFFTKQITNKRFAGLVAAIILLQSNVFLTFDTSVAYTNFWVLFYLLSLYFMYKAWPLSPISYIASISAKALTVTFLPMSIYFLLQCSISRKKKMIIAGTMIAIIMAGAAAYSETNITGAQQESFISDEFWIGFTSFATQLRFDALVILFLIPLIIGLLFASTKNKHAESMMVMIGGMLLIAPLLTGFSDQTNQPYRFVPFVTFFAVGVGILLSKAKSL